VVRTSATSATSGDTLPVALQSLHLTAVHMSTLVTIDLLTAGNPTEARQSVERALAWFGRVEQACSRFDSASELRRLSATDRTPVPVGPILFEALRFALSLARATGGAFDPTVGATMQAKGFATHYVTGESAPAIPTRRPATYRDVRIDTSKRTVTLRTPMLLDLGAVAKGLALDLAAAELTTYPGFCIEAGGDVRVKGHNASGRPWHIGVQHPLHPGALIRTLEVVSGAVCTSGDYEHRTPDGAEHHLIDPRTGHSAAALTSVTVLAPTALAADGLATAAFILGPEHGRRLLESQGVTGILVTPAGQVLETLRRGASQRP